MQEHADPGRVPVHTTRRSFIHNNAYFQLDAYTRPLPPAWFSNSHFTFTFPSFLLFYSLAARRRAS